MVEIKVNDWDHKSMIEMFYLIWVSPGYHGITCCEYPSYLKDTAFEKIKWNCWRIFVIKINPSCIIWPDSFISCGLYITFAHALQFEWNIPCMFPSYYIKGQWTRTSWHTFSDSCHLNNLLVKLELSNLSGFGYFCIFIFFYF